MLFGKKAKRIFILLILCFVLIIPSLSGYALTQKQKALNAYNKFLSKPNVKVLASGSKWYENFREQRYQSTKASNVKFGIAYIDNDSIPEMVLLGKQSSYVSRDQIFAVFTYKNGKVTRVKAGNYDYMKFNGVYTKTGAFKWTFYDDGGYTEEYYCSLKKGKTTTKIQKNDIPDWAAAYTTPSYYKLNNGKRSEISHSTFTRLFKKLTKSKKMKKVKFHKNTSANRKKYLK